MIARPTRPSGRTLLLVLSLSFLATGCKALVAFAEVTVALSAQDDEDDCCCPRR